MMIMKLHLNKNKTLFDYKTTKENKKKTYLKN